MPLLKKVKIGNLVTPNNVWLAPLAGIGDKSYRIVHRRFGAGLTFTEMTSAHGLVYGNSKTSELARLTRRERPAGIQIFGSNPEVMGMAVALLSEYPADIIDINAGCSVPKVLKIGAKNSHYSTHQAFGGCGYYIYIFKRYVFSIVYLSDKFLNGNNIRSTITNFVPYFRKLSFIRH